MNISLLIDSNISPASVFPRSPDCPIIYELDQGWCIINVNINRQQKKKAEKLKCRGRRISLVRRVTYDLINDFLIFIWKPNKGEAQTKYRKLGRGISCFGNSGCSGIRVLGIEIRISFYGGWQLNLKCQQAGAETKEFGLGFPFPFRIGVHFPAGGPCSSMIDEAAFWPPTFTFTSPLSLLAN